jgi:hypothetical protein
MQTRITLQFPIVAAALALSAGLATPAAAGAEKAFGCAVKQNVEAQVVDMDPQYVGDLVEGGVGQRSSAAVRRYMTDRIRPLIRSDLRSAVGS